MRGEIFFLLKIQPQPILIQSFCTSASPVTARGRAVLSSLPPEFPTHLTGFFFSFSWQEFVCEEKQAWNESESTCCYRLLLSPLATLRHQPLPLFQYSTSLHVHESKWWGPFASLLFILNSVSFDCLRNMKEIEGGNHIVLTVGFITLYLDLNWLPPQKI